MNVLFLTQWFPTKESPANGIFVMEHARAVSLTHQVVLIHVKGVRPAGAKAHMSLDQVTERLAFATVSYQKSSLPKTAWIQRLYQTFHVFREVSSTGFTPDIIHANVYNTADLAVLLSRRYQIPAVLTEHASTYPRKLFSRVQASAVRFYINRMQLVMPVCENLAWHMNNYGIRGPFCVVPNAVDFDIFHPSPSKTGSQNGALRLLAVANLVQIKRIDLLLQAAARLKHAGRHFRLHIVGDGPLKSELRSLAYDLDIAAETQFLGFKSRIEVAELMRQADLLMLTSQWENQPVVALEAMACGLPVLAPRVGGIPEILLPICGSMAEPGDVDSIYEKMLHMLENLDSYQSHEISEYARSNFSHAAVAGAYTEAYQRAIEVYR